MWIVYVLGNGPGQKAYVAMAARLCGNLFTVELAATILHLYLKILPGFKQYRLQWCKVYMRWRLSFSISWLEKWSFFIQILIVVLTSYSVHEHGVMGVKTRSGREDKVGTYWRRKGIGVWKRISEDEKKHLQADDIGEWRKKTFSILSTQANYSSFLFPPDSSAVGAKCLSYIRMDIGSRMRRAVHKICP